ncbi:aminotransferase class V-fold PLP-dependent enzyme [Hoyosella subflava]|uniref:Cysteine desulfurase, catalytic subunit CsdA n=1 Tax=Hoyosella subflava (strain DSM 45089 / JCM 17490 / NBRC 109087 / DQS3-9A1) TaxID=443218 RepID=F6EQV1_HOYSD|nr:aminotransferase class V-fold PLP-dependent enzyme [Hoyosella subflava]AEF39562.1 Cysteine desulfurase, catalytic subunit CsdA [Hoyosella subflava DQS3-9A1]
MMHAAVLPAGLAELADWHDELRAQFPQITADPGLAFLDSSATAQKPYAVLESVQDYLRTRNANAGRGSYPWANQTTTMIDSTREQVKRFLHDCAPATSGVHFVSGATEGLRRIALDWLVHELRDGDEIIVPFADHQANALCWLEARDQLAAQGIRVDVHPMPYEPESGDYCQESLAALINSRTRFIAATHVHHVYGVDMNVHRLRETAGPDVVICLDAAQSAGHLNLDVSAVGADFVVFSGHKAMAMPGIGVVWSRNQRGAAFALKGWSGSPHTVGILSLSAALDWLQRAGLHDIDTWTTGLGAILTDALNRLGSYEVLGCQASLSLDSPVQRRQGIVSFRHRSIDAHDLGFVLESHGFLVRADSHCQARDGETAPSVRVSTHVYNTVEEIVRLVNFLTELNEEPS